MKLFTIIHIFLILAFSSGCGYVLDGSNPTLPNEAQTLSIPAIQNQTYQADLEVDLAEQLNKLLRSNSSVRLTSIQKADLKLLVTLKTVQTINAGLSSDRISAGVIASLSGSVLLRDKRKYKTIWKEKAFKVDLLESSTSNTSSTSYTLSQTHKELVALFAKKIYERIFFTF